jgi:hypothetical protein
MQYNDNQSKFVAIMNPKIEMPKLMNALGHITAGLIPKVKDVETMQFLRYPFHDEGMAPAVLSQFPFIILKAKNGNQLKTLHQTLQQTEIPHNVFTETMLGNSADQQQSQTLNTPIDELNYFCVVLFGDSEVLAPLTKKFSIFS